MKLRIRDFYIVLIIGIVALTLAATLMPSQTSIIFGGGAYDLFLLLVAVVLFEAVYKKVSRK